MKQWTDMSRRPNGQIPGVNSLGQVNNWTQFMTWMREKIVNQTGVQKDFNGEKQPSAEDYQNRMMKNLWWLPPNVQGKWDGTRPSGPQAGTPNNPWQGTLTSRTSSGNITYGIGDLEGGDSGQGNLGIVRDPNAGNFNPNVRLDTSHARFGSEGPSQWQLFLERAETYFPDDPATFNVPHTQILPVPKGAPGIPVPQGNLGAGSALSGALPMLAPLLQLIPGGQGLGQVVLSATNVLGSMRPGQRDENVNSGGGGGGPGTAIYVDASNMMDPAFVGQQVAKYAQPGTTPQSPQPPSELVSPTLHF